MKPILILVLSIIYINSSSQVFVKVNSDLKQPDESGIIVQNADKINIIIQNINLSDSCKKDIRLLIQTRDSIKPNKQHQPQGYQQKPGKPPGREKQQQPILRQKALIDLECDSSGYKMLRPSISKNMISFSFSVDKYWKVADTTYSIILCGLGCKELQTIKSKFNDYSFYLMPSQ